MAEIVVYPAVPDYSEDISFSTIDEAIGTYVATRDDLAEHRQAYNAYEARAKNYLDRIETWIRIKADELGMDSLKGPSGTAYRTVKNSYRVQNWDEFWSWATENGFSHVVEKRAAKLAVQEIHNETGEIPPGLDHIVEVRFDVRRPSK